MMLETVRPPLIEALRQALPALLAVYGFGSRGTGTANTDSDLDLAVLVEGKVDPLTLWSLSETLVGIVHCPVDLVDLRAASTVLQYQIISTGQCWWQKDSQAAIYEAFVLSEKTNLDEARAGVMRDIQQRGTVYGR